MSEQQPHSEVLSRVENNAVFRKQSQLEQKLKSSIGQAFEHHGIVWGKYIQGKINEAVSLLMESHRTIIKETAITEVDNKLKLVFELLETQNAQTPE